MNMARFWSLVKRGISGTHHSVSKKYLQGYLNEYVWPYNHRGDPRSMFELLILRSAHRSRRDFFGGLAVLSRSPKISPHVGLRITTPLSVVSVSSWSFGFLSISLQS